MYEASARSFARRYHSHMLYAEEATMSNLDRRYVILAALEFDETGDRALQAAVRLAECNANAQLHVVHVYGAGLEVEPNGHALSSEVQRSTAPGKLREYVARACAGTDCQVTGHIRSGLAVQQILQAAADLDTDVIVLGTHQRTGLGRLMLRPVAERVLREAHCPVLIALPKSYAQQISANAIEPPCPDCLALRSAEDDPRVWCERHSRSRMRPHVYAPSELSPRVSVMG